MGETGREDAGMPCWFSSFREKSERTAELRRTLQRNGWKVEEEKPRGSEGQKRRGQEQG